MDTVSIEQGSAKEESHRQIQGRALGQQKSYP